MLRGFYFPLLIPVVKTLIEMSLHFGQNHGTMFSHYSERKGTKVPNSTIFASATKKREFVKAQMKKRSPIMESTASWKIRMMFVFTVAIMVI